MANTKNTPDNKGTEQRGQPTGYGKLGDKSNVVNQPRDRSATEDTRKASVPGSQRSDAGSTGMDTVRSASAPAERGANGTGSNTPRNDQDRPSGSTGQNPTSSRANDRLQDEDDADRTGNPASDELDEDLTADTDIDTDEDTDQTDTASGRV